MNYYIYCITNNINNKTYIGQHMSNNLSDNYMGSGLNINRAFKKYGKENFSKSILAVAHTKENIDILEKVFIALYRAEGKAEYNIADGGTGGNLGNEWYRRNKENHWKSDLKIIEKLRNSHKGQVAWNKGKTGIYSEETRKKMGAKNKGNCYRRGCSLNESTKLKIGLANKGRKMSIEQKQKISLANRGRNVGKHKGMTWKVIDGKRVWLEVDNA